MSNFLILSEGGDGCGLALRLQSEGHQARIWIREPDAENRCSGLVQTTNDTSFGNIVIADCTGFGPIMDSFRESGRLTFGGSSLHDRLETDRQFAKQVMEDYGIDTPHSEYFQEHGDNAAETWKDAEEMIRESETRLVFKPGGRLSGVLPSYVSSDSGDLLGMLEFFKSKVRDSVEFELQEFKEGVAISTEGWFNGKTFVGPFNHTIERKQLMCGDLGPSGGCTGNVVWLVDDEGDPLVASLLKLSPFLEENRYVGPIDLNAVVGEDGIFGLEFTPRFGYDAFPTFLYGLYAGNFGSWVRELASGNSTRPELRDEFAAGVRITIPPWPSEDYLAEGGVPVRGLTMSDLKLFYPFDTKLDRDKLVSSGGWGIIGVVNGIGSTIESAFEDAYRSVKRLRVPDMQYRLDLAEVCKKDFNKVRSVFRKMVA